jgi:predicted transcriptional regulator
MTEENLSTKDQILVYLAENPNDWLSCTEINKALNGNRTTINKHLRQLLNRELIKVKYTTRKGSMYQLM